MNSVETLLYFFNGGVFGGGRKKKSRKSSVCGKLLKNTAAHGVRLP